MGNRNARSKEFDARARAGFKPRRYLAAAELDFIEKYAASPSRRDAKDCFLPKDLVGSFEGKPEASEVSERVPAAPHVGPVE
jgi:hypothetical protein